MYGVKVYVEDVIYWLAIAFYWFSGFLSLSAYFFPKVTFRGSERGKVGVATVRFFTLLERLMSMSQWSGIAEWVE